MVETTGGRIVAMASYPDYNPSVWTNGISQSEFNYLFGTASGDPVMNWATQGQYPPGSTFKITSTAAAVADGFSLNGLYNCPASRHHRRPQLRQRRPARASAPIPFREALIQSCDTVYYDIALPDVADRRQQGQLPAQPARADPEDAADGARLGVRQLHRRSTCRKSRPAPSPPASGSTTCTRTTRTRARTGARTGRRTAPTCSRSSTTTARAAGSGDPARRSSPRSARAT